jgi:tetratricopeptide (TPR) repeat protein
MSFQIERGLFKFDFTDHHAVLGIPVDADVKEVRKRYIQIARRLHPDTCKAESEAEKKQASQLLSKLVIPANEHLSKNNRDYLISLGHLGRRLAAEGGKISVTSEAAKQLSRAGANLDNVYKKSVQNLAAKQYESINQALDKIAEISELNLVYLMLQGGKKLGGQSTYTGTGMAAGGTSTGTGTAAGGTSTGGKTLGMSGSTGSTLPDTTGTSRVAEYIRRAEGYMGKQNFAKAVLELREGLKLDQTNSNCHTLLGIAYLKQNQLAMAKVHINKALQLNPKDERALKGKMYLTRLIEQSGGGKPTTPSKPPERDNPTDKPGDRGLFRNPFKKK